MTPLYGFGISQEDERSEAGVFGALTGKRVWCVASGGEVPLGLAARGATVDAVDNVPGQIHLTTLKHVAALRLDPAEASRFLGYSAAPADTRARWYATLAPHLPTETRAWWDPQTTSIAQGVIWAGRFESYLARVMRVLGPVWGRRHLDALCDAPDLQQQANVFDEHIGKRWLKSAFWAVFHPRIYGRRGIDERALSQRQSVVPLGEQYFSRFRQFCTATPARDNWFLQVVLGGGLRDPEQGPDYLRADGVAALRTRPDAVRLFCGDAQEFLNNAGHYEAVHLSNLGDWMDQDAWSALLRVVVAHTTEGAAVMWRELQVARPVPADLIARVHIDRDAGSRLRETDRFPFYTLVPGRVHLD